VLVVGIVAGCSENRTPLDPSGVEGLAGIGATPARPDSNPGPPPPIPIVQFAGADQARPNSISTTRWIMGNDRNQAQTITWRLTDDAGWPSLPQSGSIVVPKNSTRLLEVQVVVPESTATGLYPIHMTATLRRDTGTADGFIQVVRQDSIPPDSLRARPPSMRR
jgi:hypothetical protein